MSRLKRWIGRAREMAESRIPDEVVDAGKRLGQRVAERAPEPLRQAVQHYAAEFAATMNDAGSASGPTAREATDDATDQSREQPGEETSGHNDDAAVVIYATTQEHDTVVRLKRLFKKYEVFVRQINLDSHPHMARQIAQQTNVFTPPYIYIRGRFWGAEQEIESLHEDGELGHVLTGRHEQLSDDARRIGKLRKSYDDALTVENIVERLKLGHILCVGDLDCWYEDDHREQRLFFQGGRRPGADLPAVAAEIAASAAAGELEASWRFDPEVKLG